MNYESRALHADQPAMSDQDWDNSPGDGGDATRSRRKMLIIAAIVALIVVVGLWFALSGGNTQSGAAKGAAAADDQATQRPSITVVVPGRTTVEHVISSTGSLAARREMPVGVVGEGGQIARVLVEPGQWVRAGQVLAVIERSVQTQQLAQLAAQIRVAQADARLAQAELERAQALSGRGFISTSDLDRKTATRDAAAARVRVAQAQYAETRARTGRLDIRAPDSGLLLTRGVEPGQIVGAGSGVLFRIARGGEMELLARVGESDLAALSAGARATVTPVGSDRAYPGQIWQISPVIDPQSRQGTARISLAYAPGLRPGGFASANIVAGSQQAPLLPESAVLDDERGHYVYVIDNDNKARRVSVTIGNVNSAGIPITMGLNGTERVVVSAGAFLNPGDIVTPVLQRRR